MISLIAVIAMLQPAGSSSVVGEWRAWRITMGDYMVSPPTLEKTKLFLKIDGTYSYLPLDATTPATCNGTYTVQGNKIHLDQNGHPIVPAALLCRRGVLWEGSYLMGMGSYVFARPGNIPVVPKTDKDWPSFKDWGTLWGS